MMQQVFNGGRLDPGLNKTLFVLIPKVTGAEFIHQYRPISLCNILYKVLTKLIVIRLRHVMQILVKQNQVSFISLRNISDNIITAQEAVHTMKLTKSKKRWMMVKVDLEKAYDRIQWDYLQDTLLDDNIPKILVNIII